MSVTFTTTQAEITGYKIDCGCAKATPVEFDSYDDARMWREMWDAAPFNLDGCDDDLCIAFPPQIYAQYEGGAAPEVNMSSGNVMNIFKALGMLIDTPSQDDVDDALNGGTMDPKHFMGRILMAEAVAPISAERPTTEDRTKRTEFDGTGFVEVQGATWIDCGVEEGYVQRRLAQLREVAQYAIDNDREVCWG